MKSPRIRCEVADEHPDFAGPDGLGGHTHIVPCRDAAEYIAKYPPLPDLPAYENAPIKVCAWHANDARDPMRGARVYRFRNVAGR